MCFYINGEKIPVSPTETETEDGKENEFEISEEISPQSILRVIEKYIQISYSFTQDKSKIISFNRDFISEIQLMDSHLSKKDRLLVGFLILVISSIVVFFIIRKSVDWATKAKSELNKYKDLRSRHIIDTINKKYNYIRLSD